MKLQTGEIAPDFTLTSSERKKVTLSDYRNEEKVLLLFFPLAFSSVCTKEVCITRDNLKMYNEYHIEVIGISVDSFYTLSAFKKRENLNFKLLSDFNKQVSKSYGCLYNDFFGMQGVAKRSVFLIDKSGTIQYMEILEDSGELPDFKALQKYL